MNQENIAVAHEDVKWTTPLPWYSDNENERVKCGQEDKNEWKSGHIVAIRGGRRVYLLRMSGHHGIKLVDITMGSAWN